MIGNAGSELSDLASIVTSLGIHVEEEDEEKMRLEYDPNRLDYSSDYGIARAVKGKLGIELGAPKNSLSEPVVEVLVDPPVKEVRPHIGCVIARGLSLDEESIRQLISMQEDLHQSLGRKRRKLAIGIHNLDVITSPITYSVADFAFSFIPLGFTTPMSIKQIMETTEVGKKYGALIKGPACPVLKDSKGIVLSIPPIINGTDTEVKTGTRNLFIDVTGTERWLINDALAIISQTLADAGGRLEKVTIKDGDETMLTPDLSLKKFKLNVSYVNKTLGVRFSSKEIVECLLRSRLDAVQEKRETVSVYVPRYRVDIMHQVDLVEEVAYGYGIENLTPDFSFSYSKGEEEKFSLYLSSVKRLLLGLGFQEIINYSLTSQEMLYRNLLREEEDGLKVESPKSRLYEYLRDTLLPGVLDVMYRNIHQDYPQMLFEVGHCFYRDNSSETGVGERVILCAAISAEKATYSDIRSVLDTFLIRLKGIRAEYKPYSCSYLIEGRAASCMVNGTTIGYVGEVKPEVLVNFGLRMPVSIFEVRIEDLMRI